VIGIKAGNCEDKCSCDILSVITQVCQHLNAFKSTIKLSKTASAYPVLDAI